MSFIPPGAFRVGYYKELLKLIYKSRAYSGLRASFCHDIAMIVQKATYAIFPDL